MFYDANRRVVVLDGGISVPVERYIEHARNLRGQWTQPLDADISLDVLVHLITEAVEYPSYLALAHVTSVGEIEKAYLCNNGTLSTSRLRTAALPEWFTARVALLRFCSINEFIPTLKGRKLTNHMITLHLTSDEFKQLSERHMA
jgi:hypothetical protein